MCVRMCKSVCIGMHGTSVYACVCTSLHGSCCEHTPVLVEETHTHTHTHRAVGTECRLQAPRPSPWSRGSPTCAVLEEDADAEVLRRIWKGRRGPGLRGEEQHARGHLVYPRSSRVLLTRPTPAHPRSDPRRHSLGDCNRHMYKMSTRAHTCTHVYHPMLAHRPHCPWEHRPAPAQHSQETLSCTVLSVVTRLSRYCTRQVRLVPWSWGLGVRNKDDWNFQGV